MMAFYSEHFFPLRGDLIVKLMYTRKHWMDGLRISFGQFRVGFLGFGLRLITISHAPIGLASYTYYKRPSRRSISSSEFLSIMRLKGGFTAFTGTQVAPSPLSFGIQMASSFHEGYFRTQIVVLAWTSPARDHEEDHLFLPCCPVHQGQQMTCRGQHHSRYYISETLGFLSTLPVGRPTSMRLPRSSRSNPRTKTTRLANKSTIGGPRAGFYLHRVLISRLSRAASLPFRDSYPEPWMLGVIDLLDLGLLLGLHSQALLPPSLLHMTLLDSASVPSR